MISLRSIALPLLVAILSIQCIVADDGDVRLFKQNRDEIDIGIVSSDVTTVGEFKKIVADKTGLDLESIRLVTNRNRPLLNEQQLLSEFMPVVEQELVLMLCDDLKTPGAIHVDFGNDRIEVVVKKDKTLGWLKKEALGDVDISLYRVFHHGKELTDDSKTLGEFELYKGAYLLMYKKVQTFKATVVPLAGSEREFDVTLETTVDDLKKMMVELEMETENQLLVHRGKVMPDHTKLFTQSVAVPFHHEFLVHLVEPLGEDEEKIIIFIKTPAGLQHFYVLVKSSTTIRQLKEYAFEANKSIPIEEMEFRLADLYLTGDSRTLGDFNLYRGASLLVFKQIK